MPVNYRVTARVVDINRYNPTITDRVLIDTNVWFWYTYTQSIVNLDPKRLAQIQSYISFVNRAIVAKATIFSSELSFPELAYNIERTELGLAGYSERQAKEYRHNYPGERQKVIREITKVWQKIKSLSASLPQPVTIDSPLVDEALTKLPTQKVDGYDFFLIETAKKNGISAILTDDGDFSSVTGLTVLTNNQRVITLARQQNRLQTSP